MIPSEQSAMKEAQMGFWQSHLFIYFYWNIVDLQCYVSFCYIAKWFRYIYKSLYKYIYILLHYGLFQDIKYLSQSLSSKAMSSILQWANLKWVAMKTEDTRKL